MKRFLIALTTTLLTVPLFAGMTFDVATVTDGRGGIAMKGKASFDGTNMRVDFTQGDRLIIKDGAVVISKDAGKTLLILDPRAKTYYELDVEDLLGSLGGMMKELGGMMTISIENQNVTVREAGDGGTIEGYPTKKYVVESSYDMSMRVMGMSTKSNIESTVETWTTDKLATEMVTFVQQRGFRSGIEDLDKLVVAQTAGIKGFPLKQVTTTKTTQGRRTQTQTQTMTISNIKEASIPSSAFEIPAGYTRQDAPSFEMPTLPGRS